MLGEFLGSSLHGLKCFKGDVVNVREYSSNSIPMEFTIMFACVLISNLMKSINHFVIIKLMFDKSVN
jgi:hypothetical protein